MLLQISCPDHHIMSAGYTVAPAAVKGAVAIRIAIHSPCWTTRTKVAAEVPTPTTVPPDPPAETAEEGAGDSAPYVPITISLPLPPLDRIIERHPPERPRHPPERPPEELLDPADGPWPIWPPSLNPRIARMLTTAVITVPITAIAIPDHYRAVPPRALLPAGIDPDPARERQRIEEIETIVSAATKEAPRAAGRTMRKAAVALKRFVTRVKSYFRCEDVATMNHPSALRSWRGVLLFRRCHRILVS